MDRHNASNNSSRRYLVCLRVEDMTCQRCVERVERAIRAEGFSNVEVDLDKGMARFQYLGRKRDLTKLLSRIEASGLPIHRYRAKVLEHRVLQ